MRKRRGISTKALVALLALVLVIGCSLGGSLAWLVDETKPVTNTFTVGDINITLVETTENDYKILPGVDIHKNPKVTVLKDSEACWLFVKVEESADWPNFKEGSGARKVNYDIAGDWTLLEGKSDVYYQKVDAAAAKAGKEYPVLAGNEAYPDGVVTVSDTLTKSEVKQVAEQTPTLTITAYAVQMEGVESAEAAWAIANPTTNP